MDQKHFCKKLAVMRTVVNVLSYSLWCCCIEHLSGGEFTTLKHERTYGSKKSSTLPALAFKFGGIFFPIISSFLSAHFRSSEGPGQVFLITLQYLLKRLEGIPESQWGEVIVSYDNMCNLDKLRVVKKQLPFPKPYDLMWLKVRKIVDRLHMRNHKDPQCKIKYGSDDLKEKYPHLNTPVAEQTFIWAGRFKKIMCAMPKRRFLFFYHRMVIRRNRYIAVCYQENRVPEFPAVHGKSKEL